MDAAPSSALETERPYARSVAEVEHGLPFMHDLFGSRSLGAGSWILPVGLSVAIFLAVEGIKAVRRRSRRA